MAKNYLPTNDAQFKAWVDNFITYANAHMAETQLIAEDLIPLGAPQTAFDTALTAHTASQTLARQNTTTKNTARGTMEAVIRPVVQKVQVNPNVTDATREALWLRPRDASPSSGDLGADTPSAMVDISARLVHKFKIRNRTEEGIERSGMPVGVKGCEIWVKIGEEPASPQDMTLQDVALRTSHEIAYPGVEAGKKVYYALRWVSAKGEKGDWSVTEPKTIAA